MKSCRTCKWFINGACEHEEFENNYIDNLKYYLEWRFDGDIQSKLNEVIDNRVTLNDDEKEDLIEDICRCVLNDLTDDKNLKEEDSELKFIPSFDFSCQHYE